MQTFSTQSTTWTEVKQFVVLVAFKALAELRGERQRTYLGFVWWLLEPAFLMLVYYLVFSVFLNYGSADYIAVLLSGLVLWQWFGSAIPHCATSIQSAMSLARSVKVPMTLFPLSILVADSVKFVCVFVVLVIVLSGLGHLPNAAYGWLFFILLAQFIFICGMCFIVAAVVPLLPDLNFVINTVLQGLFFLSAVIYDFRSMSPKVQYWLGFNPMAVMIDSSREVLLYGHPPDVLRIALIYVFALISLAVGIWLIAFFTPRYPKLAE